MNSVVSFDKLQDEVDLIESDSTNNFFTRHFVNGKLTMKQILIGLFVVLVIGVVVLIGWMHSQKCSSSLQVSNVSLREGNNESTYVSSKLSTNVPDFDTTTEAPSISRTAEQLEERRQFVREMMLDSWNAYERYAWGDDELLPVSKKAFNGKSSMGKFSGFTLVTSMSTLWTMELKEQFERGKKWIATQLDFSKLDEDTKFALHDVIVNYVGGLLSCYALTGDRMFLDKASEIAQWLKPAFNIPRMPFSFNLFNSTNKTFFDDFDPAHTSGFLLDLYYLSDASGDVDFSNYVTKLQKALNESIESSAGHIYSFREKYLPGSKLTLCADSCEMFSSLAKAYIQSNYRSVQSLKMYNNSLNAVKAVNLFDIFSNGLHYIGGYHDSGKHDTFMRYSSCCVGSMLSMGAYAMSKELNKSIDQGEELNKENIRFNEKEIRNELLMAKQITETCQRASNDTATGLAPHKFYYYSKRQHSIVYDNIQVMIEKGEFYYLSHELAESNFILWRSTHDEKYRGSAWQMAQAIHKHCRVESGGYSGVDNVNQVPTVKNDHQPPIFLSATLKYLYLNFTDDTVLPLDQFVFNSVGHPLPICGNNTMYPLDSYNFNI